MRDYSAINVSKQIHLNLREYFFEQDFIHELPSGVAFDVSGLLRSGFMI
jgi:hypothetical protein